MFDTAKGTGGIEDEESAILYYSEGIHVNKSSFRNVKLNDHKMKLLHGLSLS